MLIQKNYVNDGSLDDFFYRDIKFVAFGNHKVTGNSHLVAFGNILFKDAVVLRTFGQSIVTASNVLITIHEADVHDNVFDDFLFSRNYRCSVCAAFCCKCWQHCRCNQQCGSNADSTYFYELFLAHNFSSSCFLSFCLCENKASLSKTSQ